MKRLDTKDDHFTNWIIVFTSVLSSTEFTKLYSHAYFIFLFSCFCTVHRQKCFASEIKLFENLFLSVIPVSRVKPAIIWGRVNYNREAVRK